MNTGLWKMDSGLVACGVAPECGLLGGFLCKAGCGGRAVEARGR